MVRLCFLKDLLCYATKLEQVRTKCHDVGDDVENMKDGPWRLRRARQLAAWPSRGLKLSQSSCRCMCGVSG